MSSRTPEGEPLFYEICGEVVVMETSAAGDSLCPACGSLLWEFRHSLAAALNLPPEELDLERLDAAMDRDSLDLVELALSLEEHWGETIQEEDLHQIKSLRDLIALIRRRQLERNEGRPLD
ncbi:MAG: acyl carrier protein [Planctomycetaceae bacterium]